ncbi:hypothetical protein CANMA_001684 [Candida margitis]|uniref:uncharacterized protein n=1 Tax=Candida margitis TaxID=1775924 RepID=UPI002227FB72|nr:uncharacterized protein CANMA_001684 [Candida margitis]KAI5969237.1 hypothetical protein CANMA_001684 [Candida margitis]
MTIPPLPFKVKTTVSWPGEESGDLGFLENELIQVFSIVDESWWSGKLRRNGAEGIFPREYVSIMEEDSSRTTPPPTSGLGTPTKKGKMMGGSTMSVDRFQKQLSSNTMMNYKMGDVNSPTSRGSYDRMNQSSDGISPSMGKKNNFIHASASQGSFSTGKLSQYQQQLQLQRDRDFEIENFKRMQQQLKQQQQQLDNYKLYKSTSDLNRNSMMSAQRDMVHSQPYPQGASHKSSSYADVKSANLAQRQQYKEKLAQQHQQQQQQVHYGSHSSLPLSPNVTSPRQNKSKAPREQEFINEYEEIARKRAELEYELQKLKRNDFSVRSQDQRYPMPTPKYNTSSPRTKEEYSIDSYDSVDDRQRYSRDDLSKKMSSYITDEEEDMQRGKPSNPMMLNYVNTKSNVQRRVAGDESPPPPPPPKHLTPMKSQVASSPSGALNNEMGSNSQMRIPFDTDDFRSSGHQDSGMAVANITNDDDYYRLYMQQEELKNSIKSLQSDVMNLSELSATSAGSFMRHKYEKDLQQSQSRMKGMNINEDIYDATMVEEEEEEEEEDLDDLHYTESKSDVMNAVFEDKRKGNGNIFKKLLKRSTQEQLNPIEQRLQRQDEIDLVSYKMDINRMNSLTSKEKQGRTKRVVKSEANLIVKPLDYITEINTNETTTAVSQENGDFVTDDNDGFIDLSSVPYSKIDAFIGNYDIRYDLNEFISDISVKFHSSELAKIRGVLLHLCKFHIIEEEEEQSVGGERLPSSSVISQVKPKLKEVQSKGEASIFQINYIFKKILDALRIPCEIVLGFWKKPNEFYHNEQYVINHCWLSVLVEDKFRLIDLFNFKNPTVCNLHECSYNEFYFLAQPLSLVSTHIPSIIDLQHVTPPIDPSIAFYLPRTYSGFYANELSFYNFNNALTRLKDLEIFELELYVPADVELFTLVKTSRVTTNDLSLCQIRWVNHKRMAKIKAILPKNESIGVLQIFAGPKGLQKHFDNIHQLSIVVPLTHQGATRQTKFVQRFPTVQSQLNDLYIVKPQANKLMVKNTYSFQIEQYPSHGLRHAAAALAMKSTTSSPADFKVVIESPSGKYFKLTRDEDEEREKEEEYGCVRATNSIAKPFGLYSSNIKCSELGVYRGLVIGDNGNSWYVFAQWECVQKV